MRRTYSDEQLIQAVKSSISLRQVLGKLGLVEAGGNYSSIKARIQMLSLNTAHFSGQAWRRNSHDAVVAARPISELLQKGSVVQSFKLKKRLFAENLKSAKCESCGNVSWQNRPIPLELDHINGDPTDNRIENLRVICPNCHALTETYRGKNRQSVETRRLPSKRESKA